MPKTLMPMTPSVKTMMAAIKYPMKTCISSLLFCVIFSSTYSQQADTVQKPSSISKRRLNLIIVGSGVTYTGGMVGLNHLWYKDQERQSFRFFNDNAEWKQVDKIGHFYSAFQVSYISQRTLLWAGVENKRAALAGAITGFLLLAPIEIFDGYSAAYGASVGDLIADASGSVFFYGQQWAWNEIRIFPKFSYHHSDYAALRSNILGDNTTSRILKDYNGQTHWLSVDLDKFINAPKWINIAVGYGAEEMIYGRDYQNSEYGLHPFRQFYIALDPDLTAIQSKKKIIRSMIFFANMIKIPAPTIELSGQRIKFHGFYH
jgi:hypothetical protein